MNAPVLVVDDNEDFRTLLATWIAEDLRHPVSVARDGQDAMRFFTGDESRRPAVVLLDLEMPVMDGRAFHGWLQAHVSPPPRVVLVSASSGLARTARELGVEHAAKPVTVARLRALLTGPPDRRGAMGPPGFEPGTEEL